MSACCMLYWQRRQRPPTLVRVPRAKTDSSFALPDLLDDRVDDLESKPGAVFNGATIFVGPLVRRALEELVD